MGIKKSHQLLEENLQTDRIAYPFTWSKAFAYLLAGLIHAATFSIPIVAVNWFFYSNSLMFTQLAFVLFLIFIVLMLPYRRKHSGQPLRRDEYPGLYRLLDDIAAAVQAPPIDVIRMDNSFNAYFTMITRRKTKVIGIGVPLFSALNLPEKIAILAHETAHHAHKDVTRTWFIGSAMYIMASWYEFVLPYCEEDEKLGPLSTPIRYAQLQLANLIFILYYFLGAAVWDESQRAEYLADRVAGQVAGTDAASSALSKLHFAPVFWLTAERVARYRYASDLFGEFRQKMEHVPASEQKRIQRIRDSIAVQLDSTHPPTQYRILSLQQHQVLTPQYVPDSKLKSQLEEEFARLEKLSQRYLLDDIRATF
ncbi:M48 family metalloprotease [Paenibacillus profundus]|uniref:M48 family metalloprotease n=1 Tax=Paenibacillus profundus TaxID=1173085 RepID=A0ABS8YMD2_9BACL|nr:M48 family metallopeptidase [Paenibacillus profundus]MCE5172993.1 M48 family metalloprotease [Paenibacillus profundus]